MNDSRVPGVSQRLARPVTRPRRALGPSAMAASITDKLKAIKKNTEDSFRPSTSGRRLMSAAAVMDLPGRHDCLGCNKAEVNHLKYSPTVAP